MRRPAGHARLARFHQAPAEPERTHVLAKDHPAVVEGRTLFRNRVAPVQGSMRFLVSGANNAKIGKTVERGDWAGMPVFTLTLQERATCPRSCEQYRSCYGNAMQWPNRWDHQDPEFLPTLAAEVVTLGRANPKGFVVRLHVLGDFFSVRYVYFWADLLARVPSLRIYGYTARTILDPDPESVKIARALGVMTDKLWDRFAVRTSSSDAEAAPSRAIVVETAEEAQDRGAILCPAQVEKTQTCGTCALCWTPYAREKVIAFLRHGMKRATGKRTPAPALAPVAAPQPVALPARRRSPEEVAARQGGENARLLAAIQKLANGASEVQASLAVLAETSGIPHGSVLFVVRRLVEAGQVEVRKNSRAGCRTPAPHSYRLLTAPRPPEPEPPPPARLRDPIPKPVSPPAAGVTGLAVVSMAAGDRRLVQIKPVSPRVIGWTRQYLARGVALSFMADLFDVDAEDLGRALEAAA